MERRLTLKFFDILNFRAASLYNTSFINVDLPEPETPVIQTNLPSGISTLSLLRLCSRAQFILSFLFDFPQRLFGIVIERSPRRYFAVRESLLCITFSTGPSAIICPPCFPAPGP